MKKLIKLLFLLIIVLSFTSCYERANENQARKVLHKHLEQRYGEPFHIDYMGMRGTDKMTWYEAQIIPMKDYNSDKVNDKYYWSTGTVRIVKKWYKEELRPGDVYMGVRLNEDANDFFRPKLKEIFGELVLPVLDINVHIVKGNGNFLETAEFANRKNTTPEQKGQGEGAGFDIKGGIYIWDRIENLEEKEIYKEKIFKFIQYMKSVEMFDYVDLAFYILDERSLVPRFDTEVGDKLVKAREALKTADEFIEYRKNLMKELDKDFEKMSKNKKNMGIEEFNRDFLIKIYKHQDNKYSILYHTAIWSKKFLEFEKRIKARRNDYKNIDDLNLLNTIKVDYEEYDLKKLENNEWDGE